MNVTIKANGREIQNFEHRFVRLLKGEIRMDVTGLGEFLVKEGELIEFEQPMTGVRLVNPFGYEQTVELRVTPVKVGGEREFRIESGQVSVTNQPTEMLQAIIDGLAGNLSVTEQNPLTEIAVNNQPTAELQAIIDGLAGVLTVQDKAPTALNGLPQIQFDTKVKTVAANPNRKELIIRVDMDAVGKVYVVSDQAGVGVPLVAGEVFKTKFKGEISMYAEEIGDVVNLIEEVV